MSLRWSVLVSATLLLPGCVFAQGRGRLGNLRVDAGAGFGWIRDAGCPECRVETSAGVTISLAALVFATPRLDLGLSAQATSGSGRHLESLMVTAQLVPHPQGPLYLRGGIGPAREPDGCIFLADGSTPDPGPYPVQCGSVARLGFELVVGLGFRLARGFRLGPELSYYHSGHGYGGGDVFAVPALSIRGQLR